MIGVIDVGGGLRGIYGAGVFDYCIEQGIDFDFGIGVSAGSANISSYLAGQCKRNYKYYSEYAFRKEYMGLGNLIHSGSYLNLEYIYGTLSNSDGEYPLNYKAMVASGKKFEIVTTNAQTGKPVYFSLKDMSQDDYAPIKASSCVPVIDKPYQIKGVPYYDGGISDPIPVNRAFRAGCDRAVLILTRPKDEYRVSKTDARLARLLKKKYPASAYDLAHRGEVYNKQLDLAKKYETKGKLLIIAPKDISGMKTLNKDLDAMNYLYQQGYEDAKAINTFIQE